MAPKLSRPVMAVALGAAAVGGTFALWRARPPAVVAQAESYPIPADATPPFATRLRAAAALLAKDEVAGRAELGRLYHANGYLAEAEGCWRELRRLQPDEARWAYLLGDLRNQAGDVGEYEALLRDTLRLAPEYAPAHLKLAELFFKTGRIEAAAKAYTERLGLLPRDPHAQLGLIRVARQQGQGEAAAAGLAALVRDHRAFSPGHNLYAEVLAAQGDAAGARRHRWMGRETGRFREADDPWVHELAEWCVDHRRLAVLGTAAHQLGHNDRARALLEKAVQFAPDEPGPHELLGDFLIKTGSTAEARAVLERGLDLAKRAGRPVPATLYVNLAEALRAGGDPQRALDLLAEGIRRAGDHPEIFIARGVILDGLERPEDSASAFREALARRPNDSSAHYNLGVILLQLDRRADAAEHLRKALVHQPTHPKALALLGQLELEAGRVEEAGKYLQPLFEANPGIPQVQELVAFWRLHSGLEAAGRNDIRAAEVHYRAGLEAQPDNADLLISLGGMLLADNRAAQAIEPLATYRRIRPNAAQGAFFLAQAELATGRRDEARRLLQEAEQLAARAGQSGLAERARALRDTL